MTTPPPSQATAKKKTAGKKVAKKQPEQPSPAERISSAVEYYRLELAAKRLGCSAEELLHLGVIGKAQIMAPVLMSGEYEWSGLEDGAFPELEEPIRRDFGMSDRVVLLREDLAQIEAVGWATPTEFSSPSFARSIVEFEHAIIGHKSVQLNGEIPPEILEKLFIARSKMILAEFQGKKIEGAAEGGEQGESAAALANMTANDMAAVDNFLIQQRAYFSPWRAIEPIGDLIKTELPHLFISRKEIERIKAGKPVDEASRVQSDSWDRREESHAKKREEVLMAAIYCKSKWPQDCENASTWAKKIEYMAGEFWEEEQVPPFTQDRISRLLSKALNTGKPEKLRNKAKSASK